MVGDLVSRRSRDDAQGDGLRRARLPREADAGRRAARHDRQCPPTSIEPPRGRPAGEVSRPLGTVITVAGFKGGIGKSTVASNVAVALAQQTQQHVALIDLDLQFGDAAVMLDRRADYDDRAVAKEIERIDPQSSRLPGDAPSRLKVLAAPTTPDGGRCDQRRAVGQILEMLAATNDFVVVDTAPHLDGLVGRGDGPLDDRAGRGCAGGPVPAPDQGRTGADAIVGLFAGQGQAGRQPSHRRGAVTIPEIEQVLDYPVYAEFPTTSVGRSVSIGTPVAMSAPKSRAGRALNDLARTLTGVPRPPDAIRLFAGCQTERAQAVRAADAADGQPSGRRTARRGNQRLADLRSRGRLAVGVARARSRIRNPAVPADHGTVTGGWARCARSSQAGESAALDCRSPRAEE